MWQRLIIFWVNCYISRKIRKPTSSSRRREWNKKPGRMCKLNLRNFNSNFNPSVWFHNVTQLMWKDIVGFLAGNVFNFVNFFTVTWSKYVLLRIENMFKNKKNYLKFISNDTLELVDFKPLSYRCYLYSHF